MASWAHTGQDGPPSDWSGDAPKSRRHVPGYGPDVACVRNSAKGWPTEGAALAKLPFKLARCPLAPFRPLAASCLPPASSANTAGRRALGVLELGTSTLPLGSRLPGHWRDRFARVAVLFNGPGLNELDIRL
jgi:hypothetical protein